MFSDYTNLPTLQVGQEMYLTDEEAVTYKIGTKPSIELGNGYIRCFSQNPLYQDYYFDVQWLGNLDGVKWRVIVGSRK